MRRPIARPRPRSASRVVLGVLCAAAVAAAPACAGGAAGPSYDARLHSVDRPMQILFDTYDEFANGNMSVATETQRVKVARNQLVLAAEQLATTSPPRNARRLNSRLVATLRELERDLARPVALARRGRSAVVNWWLQEWGSLPSVMKLGRIHDALFNLGYWR